MNSNNGQLLSNPLQLEQQIALQFPHRVHNFRVKTSNRGLVLQGRTKSFYAKQLIQHAVMQATNAPIDTNEIIVG